MLASFGQKLPWPECPITWYALYYDMITWLVLIYDAILCRSSSASHMNVVIYRNILWHTSSVLLISMTGLMYCRRWPSLTRHKLVYHSLSPLVMFMGAMMKCVHVRNRQHFVLHLEPWDHSVTLYIRHVQNLILACAPYNCQKHKLLVLLSSGKWVPRCVEIEIVTQRDQLIQ